MSGAGIMGKSVVLRCVPPRVVGCEKALAGEVQGSPISVFNAFETPGWTNDVSDQCDRPA